MKKVIFIFAILLVAIGMQAQTYTAKMPAENTYISSAIGTSGFRLTNTDTVDVIVTLNTHQPFTFDATLQVDSISGNPTGTFYILGRKDTSASWTAIANVAWTSTNDATNIVSHTTALRYRQILLRFITGGTGVTDADRYSLKIWRE